MEVLRLNEVTLDYKTLEDSHVRAVDKVSLAINQGEFVAIVGHNGSGKSSLAKLFNGLLIPSVGDVIAYDYNTKDKKTIYEIRKRIGMVFQNPDNQMIASIVEDDIAFGAENLGLPREEIISRVDWALSKVGMLGHKKSTPFKMSGGQKQRLAIAGVLAMRPQVLVLDESTAMLDPVGRREVLKVAHELNREENITVVLITHYMDEAIDADRVIVMKEGKILVDDIPLNVFSDEEMLRGAQLTLPLATDIALKLRRSGMNMPTNIINEEELTTCLLKLLK